MVVLSKGKDEPHGRLWIGDAAVEVYQPITPLAMITVPSCVNAGIDFRCELWTWLLMYIWYFLEHTFFNLIQPCLRQSFVAMSSYCDSSTNLEQICCSNSLHYARDCRPGSVLRCVEQHMANFPRSHGAHRFWTMATLQCNEIDTNHHNALVRSIFV